MTTIEQLAKEFSKGNPATEAALIAMGRKIREQDIELIRKQIAWDEHYIKANTTGLRTVRSKIKELL